MNHIKIFLAVLLCRLATFASHILGRGGSSIPGKVALKFVPDILKRIQLPKTVIAVTGSNGKTSTVEMICEVFEKAGKTVAWNKEGSNQIEGVTTFLLNYCSFSGKVKADIVVMETDERYARYTFRYLKPTHYVITNLYRDQLTRNGHPEWVYEAIKDSIYPETELLLNADDPLVSRFGFERGQQKVLYFGADHLASDETVNDSIYNDGAFCPVCGRRMTYEYYHYNHIGKYACSCGYHRQDTTWTLTKADLENSEIEINGQYRIHLPFSSLYQCYNTLSAFAITTYVGVDPKVAIEALSSYHTRMGRILHFSLGKNTGTSLISKHENSVSYDQSIRVVAKDERTSKVLFIVSSISRKYFTSDTSWLWDIDFEKLKVPQVKQVIVAGVYCHDLAVRMRLAGLEDRLVVEPSVEEAVKTMEETVTDTNYVITCFADIDKFKTLSQVTVTE